MKKVQEAQEKAPEVKEQFSQYGKSVTIPAAEAVETPKDVVEQAAEPAEAQIFKFVCGVCHTCHVGTNTKDGMTNAKGTFQELRKAKMGDIPIIEFLCKKCGCSSWKIAPEFEDYQILKAYGNMALKRG